MKVLVIGAGQMGSGIAQVAACAGLSVTMVDISDQAVQRGQATIARSLAKLSEKGKLSEEPALIAARIVGATELAAGADAQLVIEAASENVELKLDLFRRLDETVQPAAILASNTSSIPIGRIAAATRRPELVCGMHFMNPPPLMPLVEVIRGLESSDETIRAVTAVAEAMGKTCVESVDSPGFIANRILLPMLNEAVFVLAEGIGDREAIDTAMKLGMNHPMGPLALADLIGLDTCLAVLEVLHEGLGDPKYRPCPLLIRMVDAGWLGRKSGRGFYTYPG